MNRKQL